MSREEGRNWDLSGSKSYQKGNNYVGRRNRIQPTKQSNKAEKVRNRNQKTNGKAKLNRNDEEEDKIGKRSCSRSESEK